MILRARGREIGFHHRPLVMGIININDDSFCGDGTLDVSLALQQAAEQIAEGADIIDVGAESARTNRGPIPIAEEVARLRPFIEGFDGIVQGSAARDGDQLWPPLLSINTWRPEVVCELLPLGGDLLNDIGALPDSRNARLCAEHDCALLIMHSIGRPKEPHTGQRYDDILATLKAFFEDKLKQAAHAGLHEHATVLDPGIDFAKDTKDNLLIINKLNELKCFGRPLLLPISRKTVIGDVLGIQRPSERDAGTIACAVAAMMRGASIFRVHAVAATAASVRVISALLDEPPAAGTAQP